MLYGVVPAVKGCTDSLSNLATAASFSPFQRLKGDESSVPDGFVVSLELVEPTGEGRQGEQTLGPQCFIRCEEQVGKKAYKAAEVFRNSGEPPSSFYQGEKLPRSFPIHSPLPPIISFLRPLTSVDG